jgi:hypothetical protein
MLSQDFVGSSQARTTDAPVQQKPNLTVDTQSTTDARVKDNRWEWFRNNWKEVKIPWQLREGSQRTKEDAIVHTVNTTDTQEIKEIFKRMRDEYKVPGTYLINKDIGWAFVPMNVQESHEKIAQLFPTLPKASRLSFQQGGFTTGWYYKKVQPPDLVLQSPTTGNPVHEIPRHGLAEYHRSPSRLRHKNQQERINMNTLRHLSTGHQKTTGVVDESGNKTEEVFTRLDTAKRDLPESIRNTLDMPIAWVIDQQSINSIPIKKVEKKVRFAKHLVELRTIENQDQSEDESTSSD